MIRRLLNKPITSFIFLILFAQGLSAQFPGSPVNFQREEVSDQKVQLALLLDASGSMKNYLEQAKGELWYTVNEILSAYEGYATPQLEIAIMVYGYRQAGIRNDFIYTLVPFTTDLDWAASELYKIQTGGSMEKPVKAVSTAVRELNWSYKPRDLKFLFISGNEKFARGTVSFYPMKAAKAADISINTIFAGAYFKGVKKLWKAAAQYGEGEYFALEQNNYNRWQHQSGYNRDYIARLNRGLYDTYIPYGAYGNGYWDRYCYLDDYAWDYGYNAYFWRVYYKTQVNYYNPQWDLVDAIVCGYTSWDDIDDNDLPQDIRNMEPDDRNAHIQALWERRQKILEDVRIYGSTQQHGGTLSGTTPATGGGTVGSFQQAVDRAVRKKVKSADAILLKPTEVNTPPIPAVGEPGKDREVGKRKASPQSSGGVGINSQTSPLRKEDPAIQAAPISTPNQRVVNKADKPQNTPPPSQFHPVDGRKNTAIKRAPVGTVSQPKQSDQRVRETQMGLDKIERERQARIDAERAEAQALQDQIIREQREEARIEREQQEREERIHAERERQARIAEQQAAERARQQQIARQREQQEREERARAERERQARVAAQQAAERERQQQIARQREQQEREERARAERERQARVAAQQAAERERQQQIARQREQQERQQKAAAERARQERVIKQTKEAAKQQQIRQKSNAPKPSSGKSIQKGGGKVGRIK